MAQIIASILPSARLVKIQWAASACTSPTSSLLKSRMAKWHWITQARSRHLLCLTTWIICTLSILTQTSECLQPMRTMRNKTVIASRRARLIKAIIKCPTPRLTARQKNLNLPKSSRKQNINSEDTHLSNPKKATVKRWLSSTRQRTTIWTRSRRAKTSALRQSITLTRSHLTCSRRAMSQQELQSPSAFMVIIIIWCQLTRQPRRM